jgi:hypothetical protein
VEKKAPALRSIKQKNPSTSAAKARQDDKREPIADSIAALKKTIATERDADRKQQERSERGKALREWATIILLFVTAGFVLGQWFEMKKVYAPIAEQARSTRESYAAVQRAFITDVRLELIPRDIKSGMPDYWEPRLTIRNSGGTPTKGLQYAVAYIETPKQAGDPIILLDSPPDWAKPRVGRLTIAPNATAEIPLELAAFAVPDLGELGVRSLQMFGVVTGAIRYRDQFVGSEPHVTKFCFRISASPTQAIYILCERWNCSDDDCEADAE